VVRDEIAGFRVDMEQVRDAVTGQGEVGAVGFDS
jgi:hypothetical protein